MGKIANLVFDFIFKIYFRYLLRNLAENEVIYFIDLDNTLINTYPYIKDIENIGYLNLPPNDSVLTLVNSILHQNSHVYILTARNWRIFKETRLWVHKYLPMFNLRNLILVSSPFQKLWFFKYSLRKGIKIIVYDDLSYNHENGRVLFYDEIISHIYDLGICYFGYSYLEEIKGNK